MNPKRVEEEDAVPVEFLHFALVSDALGVLLEADKDMKSLGLATRKNLIPHLQRVYFELIKFLRLGWVLILLLHFFLEVIIEFLLKLILKPKNLPGIKFVIY